jgi:hypothetical protein
MPSKVLEMGVCFHKAPVLGNMEGHFFLRAFEGREKFLFVRRTFEKFETHVKEGSGNGQLSP